MIRQAEERDLEQIEQLELQLFPSHPWKLKNFAYELHENPFSTIYVDEEKEIRGYMILWVMYEQAEIANIAVGTRFQSQGIGRSLLEWGIQKAVENGCENLSLEVRKSNEKAVSLYEKCGFIKTAVRKGYYEDGEDAWLMVKPLGGLQYDNAAGN